MNRLTLILFFLTISITAQEKIEIKLDSINSIKSAEDFLSTNKVKGNKLIVFNEEKHKTSLTKDLFKLGVGEKKTIQNDVEKIHYKIIEKNNVPHFRASYILFNSKEASLSHINSLREKVVVQYNSGVPFEFLSKMYSKDKSAKQGGDTGWFSYGEKLPLFEAAVTDNSHSADDVFTLDIDEKGLYYVILKTHEPKDIKEIKVLKLIEPLN